MLEPTWKTRGGRVLLISEMGDEHLVNTINMIRRNARSKLEMYFAYTWLGEERCHVTGWRVTYNEHTRFGEECCHVVGWRVTDNELDQWLFKKSSQFVALVAEYHRRVFRALANMLAVFRDDTIVRAFAMELD